MHEIAALDVAAGGQVVERHVDRVEMIDQGLAGMAVVDQQPVESLLLEDDPVVDAGRRRVVRAIVTLGMDRLEDRLVIRLGPAIQGCQQVRRMSVRMSSSYRCPPWAGRTKAIRRSFSSRTSCRASRLKSPTSSETRGPVLPSASSSAIVGGDQVVVDRVAQVGQVEPAERRRASRGSCTGRDRVRCRATSR